MTDSDWIKIGVELVGLLVGAGGIIATVRTSVAVLTTKIEQLEGAIKPIAEMGTKVALLDQRMTLAEKRLDELAHGEGMVLPFRSPHERG